MNQIRNHLSDKDQFVDASLWEKARKTSRTAIETMIDDALDRTTVTCFLLGSETANRKYVQYELDRSRKIGNGLLAITIHDLKDKKGAIDYFGPSIFPFFSLYRTYSWFYDDGQKNIGHWIEEAYRSSPKYRRNLAIRKRIGRGRG